MPWPPHENYKLQDDTKISFLLNPATGKKYEYLYHSVDYRRSGPRDHNYYTVTSPNDRSELAESFLQVFPTYVARRLTEDIAKKWFTPTTLLAASDIHLCFDNEGNWDGTWETNQDMEDLEMLEALGISVDNMAFVDAGAERTMLASTDDVSVRTFGTNFRRGALESVADNATTRSEDSESLVELTGAPAPVGGGPPV